jgi:hypothetical protein
MCTQCAGDDRQLTPAEAFVFAMDRAVAVTADCLRQAGFDEECIWLALEKSLALLAKTTAEIDVTKKSLLSEPTTSPKTRAPRPARPRRVTTEAGASKTGTTSN